MVSAKNLTAAEAKKQLLEQQARQAERVRLYMARQKKAGKRRVSAIIDNDIYNMMTAESKSINDIINDALMKYYSDNVSINTESKDKPETSFTFQDSIDRIKAMKKSKQSFKKIVASLNSGSYPESDGTTGQWTIQKIKAILNDKPADLLQIIRDNAGKSGTVPVWKVRSLSGMARQDFDKVVSDLLAVGQVEVVGGNPADLTDQQIQDSIKMDGKLFLNFQVHRGA